MNDDTDILLVKSNYRPRCAHPHVTLCQNVDEQFGWFAAYQCDRCGQMTRKEVTADDLEHGDSLPWLDAAMYEQATTERTTGDKIGRALAFFGKAAK